MRRLHALFVVAFIAISLTLVGCGLGGKAPAGPGPGEVAMLYLNALKGDAAGLRAYNPGTTWDDAVLDSTNDATLDALGISPTDEQRAELTQATKAGLSKVEASVVDEKVKDGIATVTLSIRGIDLASSFTEQLEAIDASKVTAKTKAQVYSQALTKAWAQAPLVAEPVEVDMVLTFPPGLASSAKWTPKATDGARQIIQALVKTS